MRQNKTSFLIDQFTGTLDQAAKFVENLKDREFADETDNGSVGTHFRHVLDFVFLFLDGIKTGKINYDRRDRQTGIESDRLRTIERIRCAANELKNKPPAAFDKKIELCLENTELADSEGLWCETSVLRELEFVRSHAIHHFALIGAKLKERGIKYDERFGIAPSTLAFWKKKLKSRKMTG